MKKSILIAVILFLSGTIALHAQTAATQKSGTIGIQTTPAQSVPGSSMKSANSVTTQSNNVTATTPATTSSAQAAVTAGAPSTTDHASVGHCTGDKNCAHACGAGGSCCKKTADAKTSSKAAPVTDSATPKN